MSTTPSPDLRLHPPPRTAGDEGGTPVATEEWARIAELLDDALALPADERSAFLDESCASPERRREVASLLAAHVASGLLDRPAAALVDPLLGSAPDDGPTVGQTLSHYEIVERVGSGGMGVVWKARDLRLGRLVALKLLPPHLSHDEAAKDRLRAEARAAAALDHPHICTIHEIGESADGQLYLAMPFYAGETLKQRIDRGPVPVREVVSYAIQTARALERAHDRGIIHRDIKPANLMLCEPAPASDRRLAGDAGWVRVLDFGIAKLADVSRTVPGVTPGTVAYMSPEQVAGGVVDHRTDLWSVGVVLYEALTGHRPFRGENEPSVLYAVLHTDPEPVDTLRADVPAPLAKIVHTALARRPEDRCPSARALLQELERVQEELQRGVLPARGARAPAGVLPQGERRQATILVCTVAGYAALVERLAPGDIDRVTERLHGAAAEVVSRYGGTVNRRSGEEIVLLFGVEATHEDDSLRAVRAVLELHRIADAIGDELERRAGHGLRLHSGIDSGPVIVHPPDGAGAAYRVTGAAMQVAARLVAEAAPGEVWISAACRRMLGRFVETEARSPIPVRECEQPITPYRVLGESGIQTRLEAAERAGLTAFVGRERELDTLLRCLDTSTAGDGQLVLVTGEAGMGKSRLLYEFQRRLGPVQPLLLRGRCQAYGPGMSYLPFIDVLRSGLRLGGSGHSSELEETVARIREIGPELEEFIPLYLNLLSIRTQNFPVPKHLHGDQLRLAMQDALAAILTLSARGRAAVILLEDWHWADDASRAVLRQVVEMAPGYPLLIVVTARPDALDGGELPGPATAVHLRPLDAPASAAMLRGLTGAATIPPELTTLIHERAGGNPFFLEELCQVLVEEGRLRVEGGEMLLTGRVETLELPDSVHAVIRTRMDRLGYEAREVARLASVIGRDFTRPVLEHCLPDLGRLANALQTLKDSGLIQQTRIVPDAGYRFKHMLTQEVAYASLLEHQRRELHGRVGTAIEHLYEKRLEEYLDRLAYHFSRAENWSQAVRFGLRSVERTAALSLFGEALAAVERVQGWHSRLPEGEEAQELLARALLLEERLCESLGLRARQQRIIDRLVELLEPGNDRARLAEVYVRQGDLNTLMRRFDAAESSLSRSLTLRRELGDAFGERHTLRSLGLLRWHEGRHPEALDYIEQALTISRERGDCGALLGDLSNLGNVLKALGEYDRAQSCLEEALALAERLREQSTDAGAVFKQAYILHILANIHREQGENERALELLHQAAAMTSQERLPIQLSWHHTAIAHILLQQGRIDESVGHYRDSVAIARRAQYALGLSQALRILGEVLVGLGRHDEGLPHLEEAALHFSRLQDRGTEALMWCRIASVHEHARRDTDALAAWSKARTLYRHIHDLPGEIAALEGVAGTTRRHVAAPSLAVAYYREALELARSHGDPAIVGRLCNTIGILEWTQGNYEEALVCYEDALDSYRELGTPQNIGLMLNSIGVTLKALGRREAAQARLEDALVHHRATEQPLLEGHALALLGDVRFEVGDTQQALEFYERSLSIRRRLGDERGEGWMLHHLARVYHELDLQAQARSLIDQSAAVAVRCGDGELSAALERLRRGSAS